MQERVARQGLTVTRSGCGLQKGEICGQEISLAVESGRKWESRYYSQMTRDRTHRHVHRIDADWVHPLGRRGQRGVDFWSQQPWSRYSRIGRQMWRRVDGGLARSEKHDRIRENA